jgi:hypothetical protein
MFDESEAYTNKSWLTLGSYNHCISLFAKTGIDQISTIDIEQRSNGASSIGSSLFFRYRREGIDIESLE